jgi:sarcosine oxidase subunit gamma
MPIMRQSSMAMSSAPSLIDLSQLPRAGIKGKALSPWIKSQRYEIGAASNRAYAQHDGVLIARLSPAELLLLSNPQNPQDPSMDAITDLRASTYRCYAVRRQDSHYWFALTGACSPAVFAKLCSVDLSPDYFADHTVAQTSVARTSVIIVRHDINGTLCYYLLGDSSTIRYMRACLTDAMCEFDGQVI